MSADAPGVALPVALIAGGPVRLDLHADGVAHLRLNRPEAANGLDLELLTVLHGAVEQIDADARVRAVLLSGEGAHFCAGGDVRRFAAQGENLPDYIRPATAELAAVATGLMQLRAPVLAAVQGYAAGGGGMGLVCSADLVIAAESAQFLCGATRVAMVPDAGVSVTLAKLVGLRKAMELLLLNPTLTAAQALEICLVNRIVPDANLAEESLALARRLASGAPLALAATKRLVWAGVAGEPAAAMLEENRLQAILSGTADAREGLAAVIEKRSPRFTGR